MAAEADRLSLAVIIDQASYVFPAGEPGRLNNQASSQLVTMLNWAMSPHVKRLNMAFVMIDEKLAGPERSAHRQPARRDHRGAAARPKPEREDVRRRTLRPARPCRGLSDFDAGAARRADRRHLADRSERAGADRRARAATRLDAKAFRDLKKRLLERQCQGLLEFIEPRWTLDTVVGHDAAKARLREDAALLKRGALDSLPMGYLLCGPVGTGKSFLAQCVSGEIGVPCVMLKNFRSKYVGETEGNLERVLSVLRAMGPVVVVVDEADAALGSRESEGDSGTSSRVFAHDRVADGRHAVSRQDHLDAADGAPRSAADRHQAAGARGSAHPALLSDRRRRDPADVRHSGEEARVDAGASRTCPPIPQRGQLSGADIEGIVGRAWRDVDPRRAPIT